MNTHITCSRCNKHYINESDFGRDRIDRLYKLCITCRDYKKEARKQRVETNQCKTIKCSTCDNKIVDDDANINLLFGYDKMKQRYKSCNSCRDAQLNHKKQLKETKKQCNGSIKEKAKPKQGRNCLFNL